jgi:hypothetical protein
VESWEGTTTKMLKVWSLKKDEETAKKKKPKTSPAQLRVQKGEAVVDVKIVINYPAR